MNEEGKTYNISLRDGAWVVEPVGPELTKREKFAMAAMQGILSSIKYVPNDEGVKNIASQATKQADALLNELYK